MPITYDQFVENLPEFKNYQFTRDQSSATTIAFKKFISITSKTFNPENLSDDEETRVYISCLYVAHLSLLTFLPRNKITQEIAFGDLARQSASEGSISFSYDRPNYSEFLTDPYLALTKYGSELAFHMRQQVSMRVL